jgi:drug/metabolite transporter (DMT)-like permease
MSGTIAVEETGAHSLAGLGWMLLAQACFALMNVSARLAGSDLPWQQVVASRFLVGALLAVLVARLRGVPLTVTNRRASWGRAIFGTLSALCTFYAITSPNIHLGDAATLGATTPIFVALLAPRLLGERPSGAVAVALVLASIGVVLVLKPQFRTAGGVAAIATTGAVLYAFVVLLLRHMGTAESGEAIVLHFSLVALATTLLLSIPVWRTPSPGQLRWLALTGLTGGLAQLAMTRAYALDAAARVSALTYAGIVFTYLLAAPIFGERPGPGGVLGATCVMAAGIVLARSARHHPSGATT